MLFVINLFSAVGSVFKFLIVGTILYLISRLGMVYVDIALVICVGLVFIFVGFGFESPRFMLFSFFVTIIWIVALLLGEYCGVNLYGWPLFGRGGYVLFGVSVVMTFITRRLNAWPWRLFVVLAKVHESVDEENSMRLLRREGRISDKEFRRYIQDKAKQWE
ncbi:hypothetical protein [Solidesulfovibrio carbinolicus]|uniref:hypothetical protein n=1 Tax=Solidesulfovibrio carbinolicus TaxID=296842 RepID=UPI001013AE8F|nr:hypothetical protein [Solidesulfovibrio carbinolicus]